MGKLKFKEVTQAWIGFTSLEAWIKIKKFKKDLCCQQCKRVYKDILSSVEDTTLSLLCSPGSGKANNHVCNVCGRRYINELGAEDIKKKRDDMKNKKETLIASIESMVNEYNKYKFNRWNKLEDMDLEKLEATHITEVALKAERDRIKALPEGDPDDIEDYLYKEYNVIYDPKYLKDVSQIEEYFKDLWSDYDLFDCGQGYCTDEETVIVKILSKYYSVEIQAETCSSKQDRGDRLYWVEDIESVSYKEIDKPLQKERVIFKLQFDVTVDESKRIHSLLKEYNPTEI